MHRCVVEKVILLTILFQDDARVQEKPELDRFLEFDPTVSVLTDDDTGHANGLFTSLNLWILMRIE